MSEARILVYDEEVSPTLQWAYGVWQTNGLRTEIEPFIICFSYRWYGEKKTHNVRIKLGKGDIYNKVKLMAAEREVVEKLWQVMDEAHIVVGHNAAGFDNKIAMAAFIRHRMKPPSPFRTVDTLRVARSVAKFNSNSLDNLCKLLGIGQKSAVTHKDLWYDYFNGSRKAQRQMVEYCNMDVELLYILYERLRPYMKSHPNLNVITERGYACPACQSYNVTRRGYFHTKTQTYRRWSCKDCGAWPSERIAEKEFTRPELV